MYQAKIDVTLKKSVLDPQGQTVSQALHTLGFKAVEDVRVGKHFVVNLKAENREKAAEELKTMCDQLLINPVIEEYTFQLEETQS